MLSQRAAHSLALDRASAQGDHRRGPADLTGQSIEHGDDQALLAAAELDLSLALEERRDRLAQFALEQLIGVDHPEIESLGDRLGRPRLPRGHEPDEDDAVVRGYLRHPIRSRYAAIDASTSSMWSPPNFSR